MDSVAPSSTAPRALRGGALVDALRALAPDEPWSVRSEPAQVPVVAIPSEPAAPEPEADDEPSSEAPRALRPRDLARWLAGAGH